MIICWTGLAYMKGRIDGEYDAIRRIELDAE
jgi:hypothetical protein